MAIKRITLKQFRCFTKKIVTFEGSITLIKGSNGSGKTSLLEALYFAGHLRSFRTHLPKELVTFHEQAFHMSLDLEDKQEGIHSLAVGYSHDERSVKINEKKIVSYKQLFDYIRVIALSEEDIDLIKGSPEYRRAFMDQAIIMLDPSVADQLRRYRQVLAQRNSLLKSGSCSRENYILWTQQLWDLTVSIQERRKAFLNSLSTQSAHLITHYISDVPTLTLTYESRQPEHTREEILNNVLFERELWAKRTLFGAHLDDFSIIFNDHASKKYASRGQQKLLALLLKLGSLQILQAHKQPISALLIDDFMTDFDQNRLKKLIALLISLDTQLIFTTPLGESTLELLLKPYNIQCIELES